MSSNHGMYNQLATQTATLSIIKNDQKTLINNIGTDSSNTPLSQTALLRLQKDVIDSKLGSISTFLDKDSGVNFHNKGIEDKLDSANTHHSTNATKLTNIQSITDSKLSAIQNFLDKDSAQFHLAHHPHTSKGDDVISSGGLQQVLIYGKKPDGTLQPLETLGDRLLVDVLELTASGKITTSTALSSIQVCGFDDSTNQFKTLNVDSNRRLSTFQKLENDVINASLSVVSAGSGTDSAEYAIVSKPYKGKISVVVENASIAASAVTLSPKFATSSGGTFYDFPFSHFELHTTGNCNILIIKDFVPPFIKVNIQQSSGGAVAMSVKAIY